MKKTYRRVTDYTQEQLISLTDAEFDAIVDLECAVQGVPLLPPHPGAKPEEPKVKTIACYQVGSWVYLKMADAQKAVELLTRLNPYHEEGWSENKRLVKATDYHAPKVEAKEVPLEKDYLANIDEIEAYSRKKSKYDGLKREYDSAKNKRKNVIKEIQGLIDEANDTIGRQMELQAKFDRYIELANGYTNIAIDFLNDAEAPTDEQLNLLIYPATPEDELA